MKKDGERADLKAGNWFIGNDNFLLSYGFEGKHSYAMWFFQFAFAATVARLGTWGT